MEIVHSNGDINVLLITAICMVSIIAFFIIVSLFTKGREKEEEELESYYDDIDDGYEIEKRPKRKRAKRINTPKKSRLTEGKSITNTKKPPKTTKPKVKRKSKKDKATVARKTTEPTKKVTKPVSKKTTSKKTTTPVSKTMAVSTKVKAIEKPPTIKPVVKEEPTTKPVVKKVATKPVNTNPKQKTVKIKKIGNIQVNNNFNLNDSESKMLESVINSTNRGHIFQIHNGTKIMDFGIDSMSQLAHIEVQISRFPDNNGVYIVYVVWEHNLKHIIRLSQKLRYNPNIRY